jgi:hypothetical protein
MKLLFPSNSTKDLLRLQKKRKGFVKLTRIRKPESAFSAEISLNYSRREIAFSIFRILCAYASRALDCSVVCRLLFFLKIWR